MAKRISEKKLAAQRRSAQKSTGPRTPEGKDRVRFNAVKSGLTAESAVITAGRGKENIQAYEGYRDYIWDHYAPVGFQEEYYVEQIIRLTWRLRRADRYENGCIRSRIRGIKGAPEIEASSLPEKEPTELLLRYQTSLSRQLRKLFADLERLQRRRAKAERRTGRVKPAGATAAPIIRLAEKQEAKGAPSAEQSQ